MPARSACFWASHPDAAEDHEAGQRQVLAVGREAVLDLGGELAGRGQDEAADRPPAGPAGTTCDRRCRIGSANAAVLPVAGLRQAEQVAAGQGRGGSRAPWIGVGSTYPSPADRALERREQPELKENDIAAT